jgi:hypothetical protein
VNVEKSLLITRPEHDITTRYLSKWSAEIADEAKAKHTDIVDLEAEKATRERFIGTLEKKSPRFVFINGHGNEKVVGGHNDEVILQGSDKAVRDKIIYARSCKSAKELGPQTIQNGATAFIGYDEDFIFMIDESKSFRPLQDETAALFLEPSNQTAMSILKGHSVKEADRRSKEKFTRNIQELILKGPSEDDYYAIRHLLWDMRHQVCLGDKEAKF